MQIAARPRRGRLHRSPPVWRAASTPPPTSRPLATGTVAVFAGGLDRPYPPENVALAERILAAGGAHLSEMPMGWEPRARDFPRRNRIISGLSLAVVVVEAAQSAPAR